MSDRGLARRPRNVRPDEANLDNANLDDLLGSDEPLTPPQPSATRERPWVLRSALKAFAASAVVYTAFHVSGLAPPYPLILAVCLGTVLVRQAVAMTAEPSTQRVIDAVAPPSLRRPHDATGWHEGGDGMLDAVRRWDRRLSWGSGAAEFLCLHGRGPPRRTGRRAAAVAPRHHPGERPEPGPRPPRRAGLGCPARADRSSAETSGGRRRHRPTGHAVNGRIVNVSDSGIVRSRW